VTGRSDNRIFTEDLRLSLRARRTIIQGERT
jgi:hypothetical protein